LAVLVVAQAAIMPVGLRLEQELRVKVSLVVATQVLLVMLVVVVVVVQVLWVLTVLALQDRTVVLVVLEQHPALLVHL
jgi:hypothetical protein